MSSTEDNPIHDIAVSYDRPEEGFESAYFQVESDGGDSKFLQLLPPRPRFEHPSKKEVGMSAFKDMLVKVLLEPECKLFWEEYWEMAVIANNFNFFNKAVRLAATFVCILVSNDGLYDYCHEESLKSQLNNLWESYVAKEGKKRTPIEEVWKNIVVHLKHDPTNQYSLVTESDVSAMIFEYDYECEKNGFDEPYCYPSKFHFCRIRESSYSHSIYAEVSLMDDFPILKPDDYTRLLVILSRGHMAVIIDILLSDLDSVDYDTIPTLDNLNRKHKEPLRNLHLIFCALAKRFQLEIWTQMHVLIRPWKLLYYRVLSTIPAVWEVFEVAELRRRALGKRFFTRDLFVWSFYKLGYALPLVVRDTVKLNTETAAEEHPLSQICRAAMKLALSLDVGTIELHHVMFAVLYPNEIDVDGTSPIGSDVVAHFNDFMQVVIADTNDRPQRTTTTKQDDFMCVFKGGKLSYKVTGLDGTDRKIEVFVS